MKFINDPGFFRPGRHAAWLLVAALAAAPSFAATDIQVWHTMDEHNAGAFQDLVKAYNRGQSDVQVKLRAFESPQKLEAALDEAARAKNLPALVELGDDQMLDQIAQRSYIQPFYTQQNNPALKNTPWFLSSDNAFIYDAKGRLMAFPYMLEIPVMYYNRDAFKKADVEPAVPQRTWIELQGQLVSLANNGSRKCPLTSDLPVSINLENLAAVNNQLFASEGNGLKAKGLPSFSFDSTYVRHLSLMISWVRSEIMVGPQFGPQSVDRFAAGECAILMSNSGHIGRFNDKRLLRYAVSGLPYYPEVTKQPGSPFVSGAGLWLTKGDKPRTEATVQFLAWLAQPEQAAKWYQRTGFLPLTRAAFEQTPDTYYKNMGQWRELVAVYSQKASATGQGFRIANYPSIRARFHQILDSALEGQQPAVTALKLAATEANKMVRQK
ncbi:extracellular solute-binding protein [Castellaniella sp. GW247-6E4]|uniref:extracellular solute-binding protein n=1 Tax=Castellaniella sp. GW247-6E4 TaxID=3140380 RepID=UPI003315FBC9